MIGIVLDKPITEGSITPWPLEREGRQIGTFLALLRAESFPVLETRSGDFLSESELSYYSKLKAPARQLSFLLGRYAAKLAIHQLLPEPDLRAINIQFGVFGQPLVAHKSIETPGVSISHSDSLAVALAFPWDHPMAIDIERLNPKHLEALRSQLSTREIEWAGSSEAGELALSTAIWTTKEALSKALKSGLMSPIEIYELKSFRLIEPRVWEGFFKNFGQYKAICWIGTEAAVSVVLPYKSSFTGEYFKLAALI